MCKTKSRAIEIYFVSIVLSVCTYTRPLFLYTHLLFSVSESPNIFVAYIARSSRVVETDKVITTRIINDIDRDEVL